MSRLSQINQLWSSLLGSGAGNAKRRQIVDQNAGQLPITPEVLADATQGMGDTGRRRYIERLLGTGANPFSRYGGSGGGSRTQHYGPLSGETSEIHFTDHATGEQFDQVQASPEDQAELAKRAAMQQEQIDSQLIDTFGGAILQGEYQRQPAAFAEVYRPAITAIASGQMPTAENDAIIMSRRRKEGAQRAALVDYLSANASNLSAGDVEELWQQHFMQYPEFAEGQQPPMTREERVQQQRVQEEQMFQGTLDEFATANGLPKIPVRRNEKGVLEPIVSLETLISNNRQAATATESRAISNATAKLNATLKVSKARLGSEPNAITQPAEHAEWKRRADQEAAIQQAAFDEFNQTLDSNSGAAPQPQPTSPPPADTPQQLPPASFNSGPDAERAYQSGRLTAGQPFTMRGKQYVFDENGAARRVQ